MSEEHAAYLVKDGQMRERQTRKPRAWRSFWSVPAHVKMRCRGCFEDVTWEAEDVKTGKLVRCDIADARRFARAEGWKQVVGKGWFCPGCVLLGRHED